MLWNNFLLFCASVTVSCAGFQLISALNSNARWTGNWKWGVGDDIPGERFLKIHFLNLTNPDEFLEGEVPVVHDRGPYTYRQKKFKGGVKSNGNSVQFNETEVYFFERALSVGSQEDLLNTINIPLITLIDLVVFSNPIFAPIIADYLRNYGEELTITHLKVEDLLFNGFDVSTFFTNGIIQNFLPDDFEDERFGIFKGINGSNNGIFEVTSTKQNFGEIISWDGKTDLGIWENNSYCDQIKGTDGSVFAAEIKPTTILRIFDVSACRSFSLVYSETVDFKGILGYRFVYPMDMLRAPTMKPENQCFCKYVNPNDCEKSGTADLSLCRNGPYFLTYPHFMDADPMYLEKINGLNPNSEDMYATFFDVEPYTGTVLQSSKRFQLNLKLRAYENIPMFAEIKEMLFPIFWTDESYALDDYSANQLRDFLQNDINSPLRGDTMVVTKPKDILRTTSQDNKSSISTTPIPKIEAEATPPSKMPTSAPPPKVTPKTNSTQNGKSNFKPTTQAPTTKTSPPSTQKSIVATSATSPIVPKIPPRPTFKPKNTSTQTPKATVTSTQVSKAQNTQTPNFSSSTQTLQLTSKLNANKASNSVSTTSTPKLVAIKNAENVTEKLATAKTTLVYFTTTEFTTTSVSKAFGDEGQEIEEKIETSERITANGGGGSNNFPTYLLFTMFWLPFITMCFC